MIRYPLHGLERDELLIIYAEADNPPAWMKEAVYELIGWPKEQTATTKEAEA